MISVRELEDLDVTVIEPGNRLTMDNASELLKIVQALPSSVVPAIVVSMKATTVVDSSGVGALVNAKKHVQKVNGRLVLADLRPEIARMFKLMNLHEVFAMYETEELALREMSFRR